MRVLVTGILGYIGSRLGPELVRRGHHVVGLDTGFYRGATLVGSEAVIPVARRDVRDVVPAELRGFDAVIHLAELSNDPLGQLDPALTRRINFGGSVALARAARDAGVPRFLYSSSCSVYGLGTGDLKTEDSPVSPRTEYARCKADVERAVAELACDEFSPLFLRNATAYGPSPAMRFDLVLNNLAGMAWTARRIAMTSDGSPWRPLVHVEDICRAFAVALETPRERWHNRVLNVGDTEQNFQVREIADMVAAAVPGCTVSFGERDPDTRSYRVDCSRIRDVLPAFACARTAAEGARELARVFAEVDLTTMDFERRQFTRLRQLRYLLEAGQLDRDLRWRRPRRRPRR